MASARPSARRASLLLALVGTLLVTVVTTPPASAAPGGSSTVTTKRGLTLTATPVRRLPDSSTIRVTGRGYDRSVGIYVALCVTPVKRRAPGPCGGGVNTSGASAASAWVSSNPPPYGRSLAIPFRRGGRFDVRLTVSPMIGAIDCRRVSCSIVTRADHTRSGDRRFDVAIPVSFAR